MYIRVMYLEWAGCWLSRIGMSPGTWSLKLLREVTRLTHVVLSHAMVSVGLVLGAGWAMLGSWSRVQPSGCQTRCRPQSIRGTQTRSPSGGRALAVRSGNRGALGSGDVQEGVEEEVSDALPQGGCLDEGGSPDVLAGA